MGGRLRAEWVAGSARNIHKAHFARDMKGHAAKSDQQMVGAAISQIFAAPDAAEARRLHAVVATLEHSAAKVALLLEAAEDDLLAHMAFPAEHWTKLRSTNPLERLNKEIARRSDVVDIYSNDAALIRLAAALLLEQNDFVVGRPPLPLGRIAQPPLRDARARARRAPRGPDPDDAKGDRPGPSLRTTPTIRIHSTSRGLTLAGSACASLRGVGISCSPDS